MNTMKDLCSTVAALALVPLVATSALAQDAAQQAPSATEDQQAQSGSAQGSEATGSTNRVQAADSGQQAQTGDQQGAGGQQGDDDALVARVGETEIRSSDVLGAIGMLPERLRAQPPELLIPMALEQLVIRERILQEAQAENLSDDPEVRELADAAAQAAEENAIVQVWLQRQIEDRVNDQAVQQAYEELQRTSPTDLPPLEQVRPQIEQRLRQQEMGAISRNLTESEDVVYFGPDGQPTERSRSGTAQGQSGNGAQGQSGAAGQSQDSSAAQSGTGISGQGASEQDQVDTGSQSPSGEGAADEPNEGTSQTGDTETEGNEEATGESNSGN